MKLVFAVLPTIGGKGREEYLSKLNAISEYANANEPGTLSYAVCLPRDETDTKTVYMVELYLDQAALDTHMKSPLVQDIIKWMGANPVLEGAPTVVELDMTEEAGGIFVRHDVLDRTADPYIVVGEVSYNADDLVQKSLPYWAEVFKTTRDDEEGSLFYLVTRGKTNPNTLYTLEAYTSKDALWNVHAKSQAVQKNIQDTSAWRAGVKHNVLKKVRGYLARPKI